MRIAEQSDDRLVIYGRKAFPDPRVGIAIGIIFSMPVVAGGRVLITFVTIVWILIALIYLVIARLRRDPELVLDGATQSAMIAGARFDLNAISHAFLSGDNDTVTFRLRDGDETMFSIGDPSTAAEKDAAAKAVNRFLDAHRPRIAADPYHGTESEYYVEREPGKEIRPNPAYERADRWADANDAESTSKHPCVFCMTRRGEGRPVRLWGTNERVDITRAIYVPRCRRCARVHRLHRRLLVFPSRWFDVADFRTWKEYPPIVQASHDGWTFEPRRPDRR